MERGSKDEEPTVDIVLKELSVEQHHLLSLAASVTGSSLEDFVLSAAVRAAESQTTTLSQLRKIGGKAVELGSDTDPKPDQSE